MTTTSTRNSVEGSGIGSNDRALSMCSPMMVDDNGDGPESPSQPRPDDPGGDDELFGESGTKQRSSWLLSTPAYQVDDRVFARDAHRSNLYYEAVVRQTKCEAAPIPADSKWSYLVHYAGWNSRWDRWLSVEDLLPDTPEHRQRCLETLRKHNAEAGSPGEELTLRGIKRGKKGLSEGVGGGCGRPNKRRTILSSSSNNASYNYYEDYCDLPLTLKTVSVEEWEKICRRGWDSVTGYDCDIQSQDQPARLVHHLPAAVTIRQVMNHFSKKKTQQANKAASENTGAERDVSSQSAGEPGTSNTPPTVEQVQAFCKGLTDLFQEALPVCLLYPEERPQYEAFMKRNSNNNKPMRLVDIYGCEYLLRLFVRLPALMQQSSSSSDHRHFFLGPLLAELIVLLQKNRQACFKGNYRPPKPEEWMDWEQRIYNSKVAESSRMECTTNSTGANVTGTINDAAMTKQSSEL